MAQIPKGVVLDKTFDALQHALLVLRLPETFEAVLKQEQQLGNLVLVLH